MKKFRWFYLMLSLCAVVFVGLYYQKHMEVESPAEAGVLDLKYTSLERKGYVELNGAWAFYSGELLSPEEIPKKPPAYTFVPGPWTTDTEGIGYPEKGMATYQLKLKNVPGGGLFALKKASIWNASRLYVNGELVMEDGKVSETLEKSVPGNQPKLVFLSIPEGDAELVLQVSNHEFIHGGIARPMLFGYQDAMLNQHENQLLFEFSKIAVSLLVGILYMILYLSSGYYRKEEPAVVYLSLSSIFFGLMGSMFGERILGIVFPLLSLDGLYRVGHAFAAVTALMMLQLIHRLYPQFLMRFMKNILSLIFGMMLLFVVGLPLHVYLYSLYFYMYFIVVVFVLLWIRSLRWLMKNQKTGEDLTEQVFFTSAIFFALLFWLDELIYSIGKINTMRLSFIAMALYSFTMAALLLYRYTLYYKRSKHLSEELLKTLDALTKSTTRAEEKEMSFLQAQIKPHFLFNTLNVISSQILSNPEKAHELVSTLGEYLHAKFDFENNQHWIHLEEELTLVRSYLEIEQSRFEERLSVQWDIEQGANFLIPPFTLQPLVENAIRHGVMQRMEGGTVSIRVRKRSQVYRLEVADDGVGMPEEKISFVLEEKGKGRGVGLRNVHRRLKTLYGHGLHIESGLDEGTVVYFEIPFEEVMES